MKNKRLVALLASVALVMVLVLSGCAAQEAPEPEIVEKIVEKTVTETVEVEEEYRSMSPRGIQLPVEIMPLAERLDTFDGKTIWINAGEADPVIMPALAAAMPIAYPNTTFVFHNPINGMGASAPDDQTVEEADAVIRGNGW